MDILNRVQKLESDLDFEREERGTAVMRLFDYFRSKLESVQEGLTKLEKTTGGAVDVLLEQCPSCGKSFLHDQERLPVPEPKEELECKLRWNGLHDTDFRMEEVKSPSYCCPPFQICCEKGLISIGSHGWYHYKAHMDIGYGDKLRILLRNAPSAGNH